MDEIDVSAIARKSGGGGHRQAAGFSSDASVEEIADFIHREFTRAAAALSPSGVLLIDKPEGPSSFGVVAEVRRRTGARTGHAGTLDPFASGPLLVLSGAATSSSCFVGLDKRYLTDVDLTAGTSTGDRGGRDHESLGGTGPGGARWRLAGLRGEIELPIPAASAVKIGGERACGCIARGIAVEMP